MCSHVLAGAKRAAKRAAPTGMMSLAPSSMNSIVSAGWFCTSAVAGILIVAPVPTMTVRAAFASIAPPMRNFKILVSVVHVLDVAVKLGEFGPVTIGPVIWPACRGQTVLHVCFVSQRISFGPPEARTFTQQPTLVESLGAFEMPVAFHSDTNWRFRITAAGPSW